jgi:hypothetical protein
MMGSTSGGAGRRETDALRKRIILALQAACELLSAVDVIQLHVCISVSPTVDTVAVQEWRAFDSHSSIIITW